MSAYDVVVIGGGFLGLSTAYHLGKAGAKVLLLEARDIASGTSGACSGRAQVSEGHLDALNIRLIVEGMERFNTLEEELGLGFEWHRVGCLCLIKEGQQHLWNAWNERAAVLGKAGIEVEMLDAHSVKEAEPHLNINGLMGAALSTEGLLNPFLFCWAYACAAQRYGVVLRAHCPVTDIQIAGRQVVGVTANGERFVCGKAAVMCGAWTPQVTRLAGVDVPIKHTHAEAYISEALPPLLRNTIALADFYETIHGKPRAISVGVSQHENGTLVVTEAVTMCEEIHGWVSAWGLGGMASDLIRFFPVLGRSRMLRSWGRPTSFAPDEEPLIGWLPQLDNLYVASSMVETITAVPLISEWMAKDILGEELPVSLDIFSPARFYQPA
ncbi:MAG: FAD-binding oxidoreductase [Anaerolineae bacterium]|nr:FAD-binding oxidoreductase [Anaerolineae bacterium]